MEGLERPPPPLSTVSYVCMYDKQKYKGAVREREYRGGNTIIICGWGELLNPQPIIIKHKLET